MLLRIDMEQDGVTSNSGQRERVGRGSLGLTPTNSSRRADSNYPRGVVSRKGETYTRPDQVLFVQSIWGSGGSYPLTKRKTPKVSRRSRNERDEGLATCGRPSPSHLHTHDGRPFRRSRFERFHATRQTRTENVGAPEPPLAVVPW